MPPKNRASSTATVRLLPDILLTPFDCMHWFDPFERDSNVVAFADSKQVPYRIGDGESMGVNYFCCEYVFHIRIPYLTVYKRIVQNNL